ncbi:MAG TPA: group-specific protein [Candidatus Paenibacillus intestinavium]|nr:group-specific protein [Candidatus Paenibacillus intestinavium]
MITVSINEAEVQEMTRVEIKRVISDMDSELIFWDAKELMRRTCMSWNFIQQQFFFDKRFPKKKIGAKWYFPSREAQEFLNVWINEQ